MKVAEKYSRYGILSCKERKEGNIKCAEAVYPHVPKDKPVGKVTSLSEQSFSWNSGKKRVYESWKEAQATQEYKGVMRL